MVASSRDANGAASVVESGLPIDDDRPDAIACECERSDEPNRTSADDDHRIGLFRFRNAGRPDRSIEVRVFEIEGIEFAPSMWPHPPSRRASYEPAYQTLQQIGQ